MKNVFRNKYVVYSFFTIGGLLLGWLFFHSSQDKNEKDDHTSQVDKSSAWTCAMHPQIRMDKPGKCPICGMDLIPVNQSSVISDPGAIHFTKEAAELANVLTSVVSKQMPLKEIRLYGKVQADERLLQSQVSHLSGRIEKLLVNFTGESVQKGQTLALIYSPELVTAQQELLEAVKTKETQPSIYEAAKERLRQWKLTDSQISQIESTGTVQNEVEIVSGTSGIVTARRVNKGDYISQGTVLFDIADLSKVWIQFDAYESDLPFIRKNDRIAFTVQAIPGKTFAGAILFIDPVIDPVTRVSKVRVEAGNVSGTLKPEMFVTGSLKANLKEYKDKLVIPRSSVLWTGKRSIVYIKESGTEEPIFKLREIDLGPMLGDSYVVTEGLNEGEEIVTRGTFSVDAAAQLEGKPSMMNPQGGQTSSMPGMEMPGDSKSKNEQSMPGMDMSNEPVSESGKTKGTSDLRTTKVLENATFGVSGLCEMCKDRIETAAKSVKGVSSAVWNLNTKKIQLEFNSTVNLDDIHKAIAGAGHDTEKLKADDEIYAGLPDCCKYRK
jgi:membrane fusion protein, copper/silver efflux system